MPDGGGSDGSRCGVVGVVGVVRRPAGAGQLADQLADQLARRTSPASTSTRTPLQGRRDILRHRGGDEHLLGRGDQLGEPLAAVDVELGEHVVEDQHRLAAVAGEQVVGRQPQRQREGPGLAVAGVALGRQRAQAQQQVVAVRADERDAALELAAPALAQRGEQRLGEQRAVGDQRQLGADAGHVVDRRSRPSRARPTRRPSPTSGRSRSTSSRRAASSSAPAVARWVSQTSSVDRSAAAPRPRMAAPADFSRALRCLSTRS